MSGYWSKCYRCKSDMWMPQSQYETAQAMKSNFTFYCSYGHPQCFVDGESEEQKLRRERDILTQRIAQRDDEIKRQRELREAAERREAAQKANVTKLKKRASAGVCPCCNRTFLALQKHMTTKHPEYQKDAGVNVVPMKRTAS